MSAFSGAGGGGGGGGGSGSGAHRDLAMKKLGNIRKAADNKRKQARARGVRGVQYMYMYVSGLDDVPSV